VAYNSPDPVGELRFKVEIQDAVIGRFSECSGLSAEYEVTPYEEGGQNEFVHQFRGRLKYPNLVLKRGITNEDALLKWFFQSKDREQRGTLTVSLVSPSAKNVRRWSFAAAAPVKWQGPTLNAGSSNVATETLEIVHQGFVIRS
jgi:phage tail-like protein